LVVILAGIQLITVERTNPPVESDVTAPAEVQKILRAACYDCHSYETSWPWYSSIAPASWLVASDVKEGRKEVNFSLWLNLDAEQQTKIKQKARQEVTAGDMPPWFYTIFHPGARLSNGDKKLLYSWFQGSAAEKSNGQ
jgi:hypothetical protein